MNDRAARIGLNEALFRKVNERVHDLAEGVDSPDGAMTIVCECGLEDCTEELQIERAAYEQLRADATLFAVAHGHESPDVEEVVEQRDAYDVVRKRPGLPQALAEGTE